MPLSTAFDAVDVTRVGTLQTQVAARLATAGSLLEASQRLAQFIVETFAGSVELARVYATMPYVKLPPDDQRFVRRLVGDETNARLKPTTRVLSLLGTAGVEPEWNDRARSQGHRGIPLLDARSVEAIPMVARMLGELGVDLKVFDAPDIATRRLLGGINGLFYVEDAASALDRAGRRIIPADDFIARHGIRTVFGMGGSYLGGEVVVAIIFCREHVARETAERFGLLIQQFKISTTQLVGFDQIF